MYSYELTYKDRKFLGTDLDMLKIKDPESPLLKSNEEFFKRIHLMEPLFYVRNAIDAYVEEKKQFKDEEDYIEFIRNEENNMYRYMEGVLDEVLRIEDIVKKKVIRTPQILKTDIKIDDFLGSPFLEVSAARDSAYEAFKFKALHLKLDIEQKEFIKKHCTSEYIIAKNCIELDRFGNYYRAILKCALDEMSNVIMARVSSVINKKQLVHIGNGEVIYSIQPDIRVGTLNSIKETLNLPLFENINIDIQGFMTKKPCEDAGLILKVYNNDEVFPIKYNQAELIDFMRWIDGGEKDESDLIFEVDGVTCKLSKHLGFNWNLV